MSHQINKLFNFLSRHSLIISILLISVFFILLYPSKYVSIDEHDYFFNAKNIVSGQLRQECNSEETSQFVVKDYCIYKYNIGTSIILVPFTMISEDYVFFSSLFAFLLSIIFFSKILKILKLDPFYLYFFAFFPPFIYYSRTLFSEIFSLMFFLIGLYAFLKSTKNSGIKWLILVGSSWGFMILVRYTLVFPALFFSLFYLFKIFENKRLLIKSIFYLIIGSLPFIIFFLLINHYLYGNIFRSGYYYSGEETMLFVNNIPRQGFLYILVLNILYPGMLLGLFSLHKKLLLPAFLTFFSLWFLYSSFPGYNNVFEGRVLDLIFGLRFFVPIIPLMMLGYFESLSKYKSLRFYKFFGIGLFILLATGGLLLSIIHQRFLLSI